LTVNTAIMTAPRWIVLALATLAWLPAHAASGAGQGSLGVRIVITSECSTQYTLFGPQAASPVSVTCSPSNTPFTTFSSIINNVAAGSRGQFPLDGSGADTEHGDDHDSDKSDTPPFSATPSQLSPLASKSTATSGQKTRIVHVTF
jgi:hypothetical protein